MFNNLVHPVTDVPELLSIIACLRNYIERIGSVLVRQLKRRDAVRRQQEALCDVITRQLILREYKINKSVSELEKAHTDKHRGDWGKVGKFRSNQIFS